MSFYLENTTVEERINNPKNLLRDSVVRALGQGKHTNRGDKTGTSHRKLSDETKGLVSALAQVSGVKETSKAFNIHPVTVSNLKRGMTTDGTHASPETREKSESVLELIGRNAASVVQSAIEGISDPARLANAKTSELANIAGIMMGIVEKSRPANSNTLIAGNVIFMTPPVRNIDQYVTIDVDPVRE